MNINNNTLQRAKNFDLTESELEALHTDSNALDQVYDNALAAAITEDLFIPGNNALLDEKRQEIEMLTKDIQHETKTRSIISFKIMGIAASVILLIGLFFVIRPQLDESSAQQILRFTEMSQSAYNPEVIATLERSTEHTENRALVNAYKNKEYDFILSATDYASISAELQLLRARVLMNLGRYEEGYAIMNAIDEEELAQKDTYLWMIAEGALGVGDEHTFEETRKTIQDKKLPGFLKIESK